MAEVLPSVGEVVPSTNAVPQLDDADDLQFTLPDASLFDDSLDEDFCSKALDHVLRETDDAAECKDIANLDDSLHWENSADQAPKDTDPPCHGTKMHPSADEPSVIDQNVSEPPFKGGSLHSSAQKVSSEFQLGVDPECLSVAVDDELFPESLHTDEKSNSRELPDTETPVVSTEPSDLGNSGALKSVSPDEKVVPGHLNQSANKVVPSFGKKKKGFVPPAPAAKAAPVKKPEKVIENDASVTQPEVPCPDQEHVVHERDSPAEKDKENSPRTGQNCNQPQAAVTTDPKCNLKIEMSSLGGKPASGKQKTSDKISNKKQELEEKQKERERKKQALEQKRQEKDLKKQEKEQKKQEKDLKKQEKEEKKAERERLKEEKRLAQEQKNAEREQKKMEAELKKMEREQKKANRQSQKKTTSSGDVSTGDSEPAQQLVPEVGKCAKNCPPVGAEPLQTDNIAEGHDDTETDAGISVNKATVDIAAEKACEDDSREKSLDVSTSHVDAVASPDELSVDENPSLASLPDQQTPSSCAHFNTSGDRVAAESLPPELHQMLPSPASDESGVTTDRVEATLQSSSAGDTDGLRDDQDLQRTIDGDYKDASSSEPKPSDASIEPPVSGVEQCGDTSNSSHAITDEPMASRQDSGKAWKSPLVAAATSKAGKNSETKVRKKQQTSKKSLPALARKSDVTTHDGAKPKSQLKEKTMSSVTPAKTKRKRSKTHSSSSDGERECESASEEPKRKRSKPMNYSGPVWVQCGRSSCGKWRQLADCLDPSDVPESWECSMNTDPTCNSCSAPEEQWSDMELGDSQEFVESPFIPGSVVWARIDGYPWWPAMVEEDPDKEAYYEFGKGKSNVPVSDV